MYNIVPLVLILLSLATIIVIVARKFSVLASLNIDTIQAEKEAKFKEQIISNRLKRIIIKWQTRVKRLFRPGWEKAGGLFRWFYNKLWEIRNSYLREPLSDETGPAETIGRLFKEVDEFWRIGKREEIEKKLIEVIGLDAKNIRAFRELGELYSGEKNYTEAEETFKHALKLIDDWENENILTTVPSAENKTMPDFNPENQRACVYFNLALLYKAQEQYEAAVAAGKKALLVEPNNPRYLDTMLELSIIKKDKIPALDYLEKLEKVNPENNKLGTFREEINKL